MPSAAILNRRKAGYSAFKLLQRCADQFNETNDCAVKAVAVACGVDYGVAHAELKKQGRADRDGTYPFQTRNAVKALNHTVAVDKELTAKFQGRTTKACAEFPQGTFLVNTPGHILAVKDGVAHDWSADRCLKITHVNRVTSNDPQPAPLPKPEPKPEPTNDFVKPSTLDDATIAWVCNRANQLRAQKKTWKQIVAEIQTTVNLNHRNIFNLATARTHREITRPIAVSYGWRGDLH